MEQPFDPEYVRSTWEIPSISDEEQKLFERIKAVETAARRKGILANLEFHDDLNYYEVSYHRHQKAVNKRGKLVDVYDKYPTIMYLAIQDDGKFDFGGENSTLILTKSATKVVNFIYDYIMANKPAAK